MIVILDLAAMPPSAYRTWSFKLKTKPLASKSTSQSIIKAELNKVWRTKSNAPFHEYPPKILSFPLRNGNEKQPEQGIIHTPNVEPIPAVATCAKASQHDRIPQPNIASIRAHLPQTSQLEREPYISADAQHKSRFFSLQKAGNQELGSEERIARPPNLDTSRAFRPVPQPAAVPLRKRVFLKSSAAEGLESTQRNVGLSLYTARQYPFNSSSSLHVTLFDFLPNKVSPSQSLLFLPPSPTGMFVHSLLPFIFLIKNLKII